MRTLICAILVTILCFSCTSESNSPLEGTWELIKGELKSEDSVLSYPMTTSSKHLKIFTKTHFVTVWQDTTKPDPAYPGFNGGTYKLSEGVYTENLDYFSFPELIGTKAIFRIKLEKDKFIISPVTEDGNDLEFGAFEEWKRVE